MREPSFRKCTESTSVDRRGDAGLSSGSLVGSKLLERYQINSALEDGPKLTVFDAFDELHATSVLLIMMPQREAMPPLDAYLKKHKLIDAGVVNEQIVFVFARYPDQKPKTKHSIVASGLLLSLILVLLLVAFLVPPDEVSGMSALRFMQAKLQWNTSDYGVMRAQGELLKQLLQTWEPTQGRRCCVQARVVYDGEGRIKRYSLMGADLVPDDSAISALQAISRSSLDLPQNNKELKEVELIIRFDSLAKKEKSKHVCIWLSRINDAEWISAKLPFVYTDWLLRHDADHLLRHGPRSNDLVDYSKSLTGCIYLIGYGPPISFCGHFLPEKVTVSDGQSSKSIFIIMEEDDDVPK